MSSFLLYFFFGLGLCAQTVEGTWMTFDIFDASKAESIVEIYSDNGGMSMRVVHIIPEEHKKDLCKKCEAEKKDQPILGMQILTKATKEGDLWKGAKILNAKNGRWYGCHFRLTSPNRLKVRGFIGYPLFGKNLIWKRVDQDFKLI